MSFTQKFIGTVDPAALGGPNQDLLPNAEWSRADHDIQLRRWEGTPAYIDAVAVALQNATAGFEGSESYSLSNTDDGKQAIVSSHPTDNALPQWELIGEELSSPLKNHPRFSAIRDYEMGLIETYANAPLSFDEDKARIDALFDAESVTNGRYDPAIFLGLNGTADLASLKKDGLLYYNLRLRGVTDYLENSYTMRRRFIAIAESQFKITYNNINQLYTTAEMEAEMVANSTPIPTAISFAVDQIRLESPKANIPDDAKSDAEDYVSKWLKGRPTVVSQGGGHWGLRFELTQSFRLYNWNRRLYIPLTDQSTEDPADPVWLPQLVP